MNQRYQRACEIVGCHETPWNGGAISPGDFSLKAIQWLCRDFWCPEFLMCSEDDWQVSFEGHEFSGDTLTEALTEAVLAGEHGMKERPILFSGPMVKAILDGRKVQTRRVVKPQPIPPPRIVRMECDTMESGYGFFDEEKDFVCPYGKPGDRLWVRETWSDVNTSVGPGIAYKADNAFCQPEYDGKDFGAGPSYNYEKYPGEYVWWYEDLISGVEGKWRPSIFMPRWASRLTLEVTEVRVERVQSISEEDAKAEGICCKWIQRGEDGELTQWCDRYGNTPVQLFEQLWDSINGKKHPWSSNCWVWAITFKRVEQT